MPLTVTTIASVTPRGGGPGTPVVVVGEEFGVAVGSVIFDPLGVAIPAVPTSWQNDQVEFPVPAGLPVDRTLTLQIIRQDNSDFATTPFWVPDPIPGTNALGYQYPSAEEGAPDENVDDPRRSSAADFNRLIDRLDAVPTGSGDMTKAVYDQDDDGVVDVAGAIDDSGTPRTWADILALALARDPVLHRFSAPSNGQTAFTLPVEPQDPTEVLFIVNGIHYTSPTFFTLGGPTNQDLTWLNGFVLDSSDRVEALYWVT